MAAFSKSKLKLKKRMSAAIADLSDTELREELVKFGMSPGPITDTTRSIYEGQLRSLKMDPPKPPVEKPNHMSRMCFFIKREECFHTECDSRYHYLMHYMKAGRGVVREFYLHFYSYAYCHPDEPIILAMSSDTMSWFCAACETHYTQSLVPLMDAYDKDGVQKGDRFNLPRDGDMDQIDGLVPYISYIVP